MLYSEKKYVKMAYVGVTNLLGNSEYIDMLCIYFEDRKLAMDVLMVRKTK